MSTQTQSNIEEANAEVRNRPYCQHCGISVRSRDYDHKYLQAGGVLTGPFCSKDCQFAWLIDPTKDEAATAGEADQ